MNGDHSGGAAVAVAPARPIPSAKEDSTRAILERGVSWILVALVSVCALWGAWKLIDMLLQLPLHDADGARDWLHVLLALFADFARTVAAVFLGAAWTLPVGILIGLNPKWSQRLQPIVQVLASFPAPMLYIPITIVMLGTHVPFNIGCVFLMMMGTQWYVLFNVIAGAMAIPSELKEVSSVYHTPRWRRWARVYIPGVFPHLVTGLITAAGGAWNATIIAEVIVVSKTTTYTAFGLGSMITLSSGVGDAPLEAAAAVTMAIAVVTINRLMWRRIYRLAERRYSLET